MFRVLLVASEAYPLAKTGGLADCVAGLAKALSRKGCDVKLLLPGYPEALDRLTGCIRWRELGIFPGLCDAALVEGESPGFAVDAWLVDCPSFYRRPGGLYQDTDGKDWPDNAQRFALLAHAGAQLALGRGPVAWRPDIVHLNDWQTGPLAALLARESRDRPACVFTIHNLAFQGLFGLDALDLLGLPSTDPNADGVEFWGQMSFLKAGICCADRVTTVSEEYASEILTPQFGCGLDGVLRGLRHSVIGIRNGIDDEEWDPSQDPWLPARYRADDLRGKEVCKERLRNELGLVQRSATPLIACLNRLTHQKMADLLPECLPTLVAQGAQVVVLGRGDPAIEKRIEAAVHDQGGEAVAIIGYDEALAHRLLAGADILLAPARFEPCGLTQMYAMHYGTVPVASRLGGLAETITDCAAAESGSGAATGFLFDGDSAAAINGAVERALACHRQAFLWRRLVSNGMHRDFSWSQSARHYLELYTTLASARSCKDADVDARPQAYAKSLSVAALRRPFVCHSKVSNFMGPLTHEHTQQSGARLDREEH